jgi:hypothetical protein
MCCLVICLYGHNPACTTYELSAHLTRKGRDSTHFKNDGCLRNASPHCSIVLARELVSTQCPLRYLKRFHSWFDISDYTEGVLLAANPLAITGIVLINVIKYNLAFVLLCTIYATCLLPLLVVACCLSRGDYVMAREAIS